MYVYTDMTPLFGRPVPEICMITNTHSRRSYEILHVNEFNFV